MIKTCTFREFHKEKLANKKLANKAIKLRIDICYVSYIMHKYMSLRKL